MKIYLARPISGHSYEEVTEYYKVTVKELIQAGYEVLCPMNGKTHLRTEIKFKAEGYGDSISSNHAIVERDRWMVEQSDVVYANLLGSEHVSIGTMMELAWSHDKHKHTIISMEDLNIHNHAFVLEAADIIFKTHQEAMEYLKNLLIPIYKESEELDLILTENYCAKEL